MVASTPLSMQGPGKTKRLHPKEEEGEIETAESPKVSAVATITVRPPPNVKVGAVIGEKYRIEHEIGRGGYGVVLRAIHLTLDQRVAIKVLTEGEGSTDAEFAEDAARFRREAKATAALRGEHVVRILDVDVLDDIYPYIVMEYLEGKTLHDLVYSQTTPIEDAVDYTMQVLAALAEAHAVGIVHRDLKPANVFLSKGVGGGTIAKVLDFGVSKMLGGASQRLTRTGAVVGTVAYMAPEQMLDAKGVDGRADLWSLGLLLYEALVQQHPFGSAAAGPKIVTAILKDPIVPVRILRPEVPIELDEVVTRLLEKSPERRFATALEVANALAPFGSIRSLPVHDEIRRAPPASGAAAPAAPAAVPAKAAPMPPLPPPKTKPKRSRLRRLFVILLAVLVVGAVVVGYRRWLKPRLAHTTLPWRR